MDSQVFASVGKVDQGLTTCHVKEGHADSFFALLEGMPMPACLVLYVYGVVSFLY